MTTMSSVETTIRTGRARDAWNSYSGRLEDATGCHVKVTVEDGELCFWVMDPYGNKCHEMHGCDGEPFETLEDLISETEFKVKEHEAQVARDEQHAEDLRLSALIDADAL